jgi:hypothetical protein
MLKVSTPRPGIFLLRIAPFILLSAMTAYGQSLGDVARENREKKAETSSAAPKVITNADLPKGPDGSDGATATDQPAPTAKHAARKAVARTPVDPLVAEHWRRQILAQKRSVANLERRLATLKASIPYVDASSDARGEVLNRRQAWEQQRKAELQERLDDQRAKLEEMQETARRAGMHTAVTDP